MATIVQCTLKTADSLPENYLTNQFCIDGYDVGDGADSAIVACFADFYSALTSQVLSSWIAQNGHVCKLYTAGGPKPNYPYQEETFNLTSAPSGAGLPTEVALCLSFQGLRIPGTPQARRRGRVYIGTLKATVNVNQRPASAAMNALRDAGVNLAADLEVAFTGARWAVWSALDASAVPLTECWVDDSFDTQRSRGQDPTTRVTGDLT